MSVIDLIKKDIEDGKIKKLEKDTFYPNKYNKYTHELAKILGEITDDDITSAMSNYTEIKKLITLYDTSDLEKKKIAENITNKASILFTFLDVIKSNLIDMTEYYRNIQNKSINDFQKMLNILLRLANQNGEKFSFKHLISTYKNYGYKYNNSNSTTFNPNDYWIITSNDAINKYFDDSKEFSVEDLKNIATEIMKTTSLIVIPSSNIDSRDFLPTTATVTRFSIDISLREDINYKPIDEESHYFSLYYVLHDDELSNSFKAFYDFIDENDVIDIKNIDEDRLFELITQKQINKTLNIGKSLVKTSNN